MNEPEKNPAHRARHGISLEYWLRPGDALLTEKRNGRRHAVRLVRGNRALNLGVPGIAPALAAYAFAIQLLCLPLSVLTTLLLHLLAHPLRYTHLLGLSPYCQRFADSSRRLETLLCLPAEIFMDLLSRRTAVPPASKTYSGTLRGDMYWEGDISICGDIVVPHGTTLTIKAGTKISFLHRESRPVRFMRAMRGRAIDFSTTLTCHIYVDGAVCVDGTPEQPVLFSGDGSLVFSGNANGQFSHCVFNNCDTPLLLCDSARLKAAHCRMIMRGGIGLSVSGGAQADLRGLKCSGAKYACVASGQARLRLRDCEILDTKTALLTQDAARAFLRGTQVSSASDCAVLSSKGAVAVSHSELTNCAAGIKASGTTLRLHKTHITETASCGVTLAGGHASIRNSIFDAQGEYALRLGARGAATLLGCEFLRSKNAALLAEDGSTMKLVNCRLQGNSSGIELHSSSADISATIFQNSTKTHLLLRKSLAVLSEVNMEASEVAVCAQEQSKAAVNNLYIRDCAQNAVQLRERSAVSGYLLKCGGCGAAAMNMDGGSTADLADAELSSAPVGLELKGASSASLRRTRVLNCAEFGVLAEAASFLELVGCEIKTCGTALHCRGGTRAIARSLYCKDSGANALLFSGMAQLEAWQLRLHNSGSTAIVAREASTLHIRDLEAHSQPGALLVEGESAAAIRGGLLRDTADCGLAVRGGGKLSLLSVGIFGGIQAIEAAENSALELENCLLSVCGNGLRASSAKTTLLGLSIENCPENGLSLSGGAHRADTLRLTNCKMGLTLSEAASLSLDALTLKACLVGAAISGGAALAVKNFESGTCENPLQISEASTLVAENITARGPGRIGLSVTGNSSVRAAATAVSGYVDGLICAGSAFESLALNFTDNAAGLTLSAGSYINCGDGRIANTTSDGLYLGENCKASLKNVKFSGNAEHALRGKESSTVLENCHFGANGTSISHSGGALKLSSCRFTASTRGNVMLHGGEHRLNGADISGGAIGLGLYDGAQAQAISLLFQSCQTALDLRDKSSLTFEDAAMRHCATGLFAGPNTTVAGVALLSSDSSSAALQAAAGAEIRMQRFESLRCGGTAILCAEKCSLHIGAINLDGGKTGLRLENGSAAECLSGRIAAASSDGVYLGENCALKLSGVELAGNAGHGLYSQNAKATLADCRLHENGTGIFQYGGELVLSACAFTDNTNSGVKLYGGAHQLGDANFSGGAIGLELYEKALAQAGTLAFQNCRTGISLRDGSELKLQNASMHGCPTGLLAELKSTVAAKSLKAADSSVAALRAADGAHVTLEHFEAQNCAAGALLRSHSELRLSAAKLNACKTGLRLENGSKAFCTSGEMGNCADNAAFLIGASSLQLSDFVLKSHEASFGILAQKSSSVCLERCTLYGGRQAIVLRESSSETSFCRFDQTATLRGTGTALEADSLSRAESCRDHFSGYACGIRLEGSARAYAVCTHFSNMAEAALSVSGQSAAKTESCRYEQNKTSVRLTDSAHYVSRSDEFSLSETGLQLQGESRANLTGTLLKGHSSAALLMWGNNTRAESKNCRYEQNKISLLAGGNATYSSHKDAFALSDTGLRLESGAQAALSGAAIQEHRGIGLEVLGAKTRAVTDNCLFERNQISIAAEAGAAYTSNKDTFRLSATGLRIRNGAQAGLAGTLFEEHSEAGLLAWDSGTAAQTAHCRHSRNHVSVRAGRDASYSATSDEFRSSVTGLIIEDGGRAALSGAVIREHSAIGLQVLGAKTSAETENCRWEQNKTSLSAENGATYSARKDEFLSSETGLQIMGGARAALKESLLEGHCEAGLLVWHEGSAAETAHCRHTRNRTSVRAWDGAHYSSREDEFSSSESGLSFEGRARVSLSGTVIKDHAATGLRLSGGKTAVASENCRYGRNKLSVLAEDDAVFSSNRDEFSLSETGLRLHIGAKTLLAEARLTNHSNIALQLFSARADACGCLFTGNKIAVLADSASRMRLHGGACSGNQTGIIADGKSRISARDALFSDNKHFAAQCGAGARFAALKCIFKDNKCGLQQTTSSRARLCATRFEGQHEVERLHHI